MILAPGAGETQVEIAEHAGGRDLADIGQGCAEPAGAPLEMSEPARHLASLMRDPAAAASILGPEAALIDLEKVLGLVRGPCEPLA